MLQNNPTLGSDDVEQPMELELFELAAREVNWHLDAGEQDWRNSPIVRAARQVLVEGKRTTVVAEEAGISQAWLSQAIGRVREQLEVICARENWVYKMVVLPPDAMALVENLQNKTIDPLKQQQVQKLAKKKARKTKVVKSKTNTEVT
jgi:TrfB transcriptional repressor